MKIIALFLSFYMFIGGLIPKSDFSQLMHIGDLYNHYLEHKAEANIENNQLSLLDFLCMHFFDTQHHNDTDHEEDHQQLPFQTLNSLTIFIPDMLDFPNFSSYTSTLYTKMPYKSPFYLNGFLSTSFHPPTL